MNERRIAIPTFDPQAGIDNHRSEYDWSTPEVLTVREDDTGLMVIMGTPDHKDAPRVSIERYTGGWRVFVNHDNGDGLCIVEIGDDKSTVMTPYTKDEPLLVKERVVTP
jgi:hypothetical protein